MGLTAFMSSAMNAFPQYGKKMVQAMGHNDVAYLERLQSNMSAAMCSESLEHSM